jgi:antitoxin MazE
MRARVIKIGNSQGLRIPKPLLEQTGIMDDVERREGRDKAFRMMGKKGDDEPLIDEKNLSHSWDEEEWQW